MAASARAAIRSTGAFRSTTVNVVNGSGSSVVSGSRDGIVRTISVVSADEAKASLAIDSMAGHVSRNRLFAS